MKSMCLFRSPELMAVTEAVSERVNDGIISLRRDRVLHADVGLSSALIDLASVFVLVLIGLLATAVAPTRDYVHMYIAQYVVLLHILSALKVQHCNLVSLGTTRWDKYQSKKYKLGNFTGMHGCFEHQLGPG